MVSITFIAHDGARETIDAPEGQSIMKEALNAGIEGIVGECGGNCACGTCRVYVPEAWRDKLPPAGESEREMVEYAGDETEGVRLCCQIPVKPELDGIELTMPESQY